MSIYTIQDTTLTDIADAIRSKTGKTASMTPVEMVNEIESISGGGDITDGIVVTAIDADKYVTSVDYYGEVLPRYIFGAARGDNDFSWSHLRSIDFKSQNVYLTRGNFFYCGLYELSTTAIKGRDPSISWQYNNNTHATACFRHMKSLVTLSLPEFVGFLNHYEIAGCTALKTVYLPKVTKLASYGSSNRGCFLGDTALENVQIGSIGYAVDNVDTNPFGGCTQSGLSITIYTTGSYTDTAVANIRRGATNATIIVKASEVTTYGGTSYAAGDTIVTSTP